jgi:hypothetical protein
MRLLTERQLERMRQLAADHRVVGERDGSPVLERSDGRLVLVQPNGELAATVLTSRVQSYLHVDRC